MCEELGVEFVPLVEAPRCYLLPTPWGAGGGRSHVGKGDLLIRQAFFSQGSLGCSKESDRVSSGHRGSDFA